jgi:hypothetical protein
VGPGNLVAQVHPAAERPAHLELADRARFEADERHRVVLVGDRVNERVRVAQNVDRPVPLPTKLRMISMQWQPRSMIAPPPVSRPSQNQARMRSRVRLARADPRHVADRAASTDAIALSVFGV